MGAGSHGHAHDPGSGAPDHDHHHDHVEEGGSHTQGGGHSHDHAHELRGTPLARLTWAFGITATFMLVEAGVGWWSGSLALLADAGHMLADAAALLLADRKSVV